MADIDEYNAPEQTGEYPVVVLLVDDQAMVCEAVRRALAHQPDITFHYCGSPTEAVRMAEQLRPTVILQDLVMPDIDGLTLVSQYRAHPITSDIPIIVLSTNENPQVKGQAFAMGANDYLVKLPDKIELVARIRYHTRAYLNQAQRDEAFLALRQSQQQLLEANENLSALNKQLETLTTQKSGSMESLTGISHQIRTPVNGIVGVTALLAETDLSKEQRDYVESLRHSAETLLDITNNILDYSKIESGNVEIAREPFDLHACIEQALEMFRSHAAGKKLDLAYHVDDALPAAIVGDITRLRQVLANLLSNAFKFTSQGEIVVETKPAQPDARTVPHFTLVQFSVRDTGSGISPDQQQRLRESLLQPRKTSAGQQFEDAGLGLAICKKLVQLMGGNIWLESTPGQGTVFHFTIQTQSAPATPNATWRVPQPSLAGKKLLMVEDSVTVSEILSRYLGKWGMQPQTAATAEAAIQLVSREKFDVVLLDLELPGLNAPALAGEIRGRAGQFVPIIAMTGATVNRKLVDFGVTETVAKPVRPAQLLEAIKAAVGAPASTPRSTVAPPQLDPTLAQRLPLQLLVADDNPINQKVAASIVKKLGYIADIATSGAEVLVALDQKKYDVIFLDVQMPEMDGLETARRICKKFPLPDRPRLIAMTGQAQTGDREQCLRAGMDDYISKPVNVQEVQVALEKWGPGRPAPAATQVAVPKAESVLDPAIIAELQALPPENGVSMMKELSDMFCENAPRCMTEIERNLADPRQLAFHAHTLRSMALNLGAKRVVELCRQLEEQGCAGKVDNAARLLAEIRIAFAQTESELRRLIPN